MYKRFRSGRRSRYLSVRQRHRIVVELIEEHDLHRLPVVSVVGRPNVGKSSLFNRILRKRIAVVDDEEGVTRDRNYQHAVWGDRKFIVIDTGGLIPTSDDPIPGEIHAQVDAAMAESDVVVFMVDATVDPTDLDLLVAQQLRREHRSRLVVAANKADKDETALESSRYVSLGCGEPIPVSALHGRGVADLLDRVVELLPSFDDSTDNEGNPEELSIAFLGRPNAGKSSLVNKLVNSNRMIVDSVPGTTRDSIDTVMTWQGCPVRLIDTAGLRRKSQVKHAVEYYSNLRTMISVDRARICVLLIDATRGVAEQDLRILTKIMENHKGAMICLNKWDILEKDYRTYDTIAKDMRRRFPEIRHLPIVSISALTGQRIQTVLETAKEICERMKQRVTTGEFSDKVHEWFVRHPHPFHGSKEVRILGGRQAQSIIPVFEIFCTNPQCIVPSYRRYLMNKIQDTYDFEGCPIVLKFKGPGRPGRTEGPVRGTEQLKKGEE